MVPWSTSALLSYKLSSSPASKMTTSSSNPPKTLLYSTDGLLNGYYSSSLISISTSSAGSLFWIRNWLKSTPPLSTYFFCFRASSCLSFWSSCIATSAARLAISALVLPRWLALPCFFLGGGCQRAFRGTLNGAPLGSD